MGKKSVRDNKNIYQVIREEQGLTRAQASELMPGMSADRIERIESGRVVPVPEDVLLISDGYRRPELCNYYCSHECVIGQQYVPAVEIKSIAQTTVELLAAFNRIDKLKERLLEIVADGEIKEDELSDFWLIRDELEKFSITVEALQLWIEKATDEGRLPQK